jgi:hypothetical protein
MVLDKYPKSTMWVAGDFNLPDIDWPTNTFSGNRYLNEINQTLLQIEELGLSQTVKFPTRDKSTLELFEFCWDIAVHNIEATQFEVVPQGVDVGGVGMCC